MDMRRMVLSVLTELGFDPAGLGDSARLREDLDMDSTELVEIAVAIERRIPVTIDTGPFAAVRTVGEIVEFVETAAAQTTTHGG